MAESEEVKVMLGEEVVGVPQALLEDVSNGYQCMCAFGLAILTAGRVICVCYGHGKLAAFDD